LWLRPEKHSSANEPLAKTHPPHTGSAPSHAQSPATRTALTMARKSPHSHRANAMTATVLILNGDDYEDLELHYPRLRLIEAGYRTALVSAQSLWLG